MLHGCEQVLGKGWGKWRRAGSCSVVGACTCEHVCFCWGCGGLHGVADGASACTMNVSRWYVVCGCSCRVASCRVI